ARRCNVGAVAAVLLCTAAIHTGALAKTEMKTLFLAWQDTPREASSRLATRGWYPIGRLDIQTEQRPLYTFRYTQGALIAKDEAGFQPLDAFPRFERAYESPELFPLFQNRVPDPKRNDYADFVKRLGLTVEDADPFEI